MGATDGVSKEVAEMLFYFLVKGGQLGLDAGWNTVDLVGKFGAEKVGKLIDFIDHNRAVKEMLGMEGPTSLESLKEIGKSLSMKTESIRISDLDTKDFENILKEQGALYVKTKDLSDNCNHFIFLKKDAEKIDNAMNILMAQRGTVTELNPKLYFNSLSPDEVHVVEGLSAVEMELFRHYAREEELLFTSISKREGDMIVCSKEDIKKARRALLYTGWALTGANGARVREQVERRLSGRTAINISAEEGERELYIVSKTNPGNYVNISAEDYALYKDSKQVSTTSRSTPDFYAKCIAACDSLSHPVVLSAEQFHAGMTPEELNNAHTIDLFPDVHDDDIEKDQVNRLVNLVAMKAGMDNEHNASWGLWDPSVSYSEFATYENIMDEDERDARYYAFEHFKQAAYYSQMNHQSFDVDMNKNKSVDYIIAKAEEKRRQQASEMGYEQEYSH